MSAVDPSGGGWGTLRELAFRLAERETVEIPLAEVPELQSDVAKLIESGVLVERAGAVRFFHETLFDHVLARAFVEDGRSLVDEVLSRPQELSRRPLIRRILSFERGIDRERYRLSVRSLIGNRDVRFHLRDVVFDVMREDTDPLAQDWELIAPMVVDDEDENHSAAWNVAIQPAYLRVIDRTATLLRWMTSNDKVDRDRATSLLVHLLHSDPARGAILMWPFLDLGTDWHERIRYILSAAASVDDRRMMDFVLAALDAGVFDSPQDSESLWVAARNLPAKRPRWGVELLAAYIRRALDQTTSGNPFETTIPRSSSYLEQFIQALAQRAPSPFARAVLPIVTEIVTSTADAERHIAQGDPWSLRYSTQMRGVDGALFQSSDAALREVSAKRSATFTKLAPILIEQAHHQSVRFLLYRAWAANPKAFWRTALRFLLDATNPFECGYADSPYWVTRELLHSIQTIASRSALEPVEERILEFYPDWERGAEGRRSRGLAQLTLLDAFADRKLSDKAQRQRDELRRKLGPSNSRAPRGIQVGYVSSPIPDAEARRMTDRNWLQAIGRYDTDERAGTEFLKGGAVELSRVLEQQTIEEPTRFAELALRFPSNVNEQYVNAVLRGLGNAKGNVPAELVLRILRYFFAMPGRPGGRWLMKPLARLADREIPTDILDIVSWHATESNDPERDTWRRSAEDGVEYYGGDPFTAGINSVRGAAAETLSVLIWPSEQRLTYLMPALEQLVRDPVIAVRVCAAVTLRSAYRHDRDRAVDLFVEMSNTDDALLASRPAEDFLAVAVKSHLNELRPILSRMLRSESTGVQAAAGRQVALAALNGSQASELVESAMSGPSSTRLGVAQVAAHNIISAEVGDTCARWLPEFFNDGDEAVRQAASEWVSQLGPSGMRHRHDLAIAYIASAAYRDDESGLLRALDDSAVPVADVALEALRQFVEHRRSEMGDIRLKAAYAAMLASKLAIRAYTSASTTDGREQALDIIDTLLAAKVSEAQAFVESFD